MHPARLIALSYLATSVLLVVSVVIEGLPFGPGHWFVLTGGVFCGVVSAYGVLRYDRNPIVTEYDSRAYLLLGSSAVISLAVLANIGAGVL